MKAKGEKNIGLAPHKGQRHGKCGHYMSERDEHHSCPSCREKGKGKDPCVLGEPCTVCDSWSPETQKLLVGNRHKYAQRKLITQELQRRKEEASLSSSAAFLETD